MTIPDFQQIIDKQKAFEIIINLYKQIYKNHFKVDLSQQWIAQLDKLRITINDDNKDTKTFVITLNRYNDETRQIIGKRIEKSFEEINSFFSKIQENNKEFPLDKEENIHENKTMGFRI